MYRSAVRFALKELITKQTILPKNMKTRSILYIYMSVFGSAVKNPPTTWETWVGSVDWEDPLEKGKATCFSILAWRIPDCIVSLGGGKSQTRLSDFHFHTLFN